MKGLILIAAYALSGCAGTTVYEASVGVNVSDSTPWSDGSNGGFEGGREIANLAIRQEHTSGMFVEFRHVSHFSRGWPVNDKREDWIDSVNVGYRFQVQQ